MSPKLLLVLAFFLTLEKTLSAQSLTGVWKGTSLCQMRNSACHDEIVVYHISKNKSADLYQVSAGKIIDGKEDNMGIINFVFDPQQKILFSDDSVRNVRWEFEVNGKKMHGTLVSKGNLFRIVDLEKEE